MYQLIKKDLLVQKKAFILSLVLIIFYAFYFGDMGPAGLALSAFTVTYMLTLGAFCIDEKNNSDKLLISLPIKRSSIVLSKYLFVLVITTYVILLNFFITTFVNLLHLSLNPFSLTTAGVLSSFAVPVLYSSIALPIIFRFGYLKSRMINFIVFFSLIAGFTPLINKISEENIALRNSLLSNSTPEVILTILLPTLLLFALSYILSLFFYNKREF